MPTSNDYIKICTNCRAFCCTAHRPPVTEEEKNTITEAGHANCFVKVKDGIYEIEEKDGKCPYLQKDYSCKIQEVKPSLCKTWPIIPRYKNDKRDCLLVKCPLFPLLSTKDLDNAKEEARKIPIALVKQLWTISEKTKNEFKKYEYEKI